MKRVLLLLCLLLSLAIAANVSAQQPSAASSSAPPPNAQQGGAQSSSAQPAAGQSAGTAQSEPDAPATKADVEAYLEVTHTKELSAKMMEAMLKPMHQMMHETYLKNKDKLPPDFEAHMDQQMDDMFKGMPFDEMIDAMIPSYQKHFTRSDMAALTVFYASPTGQKILKEMPAITAEAMQNMMPLIQKYTSEMQKRLQEQVAQMLEQPTPQAVKNPPPTAN